MTDPAIRWLSGRPTLDRPTLVVMLSGWIDAGAAAAAAMQALLAETTSSPIATFDDDTFVDFRARRPVMELREGLNSVLRWSEITLSAGRDRAGHDVLLLHGPVPDMAWHRFVDATADLAVELGVRRMVGLGAYPFAAPHSRPSRVSCTSPSHDVLATAPFLRSSVDVPAGVEAALEHGVHDRGIPSIGLWAQVPHYVATMTYPTAAVALLDALREAADVAVDAADLRQDALAHRQRLDALVAGNDEHLRMVAQLEEVYDATADDLTSTSPGPELELRSGDELAAELEQFLRDWERGPEG